MGHIMITFYRYYTHTITLSSIGQMRLTLRTLTEVGLVVFLQFPFSDYITPIASVSSSEAVFTKYIKSPGFPHPGISLDHSPYETTGTSRRLNQMTFRTKFKSRFLFNSRSSRAIRNHETPSCRLQTGFSRRVSWAHQNCMV
jgi:hypothetical protein